MSQFQQPAISNPEDKFVAAEHNGALLLFFPSDFKSGITTAHGNSDAVSTRIVNLDTGRVIENALIFATALVTQLKSAVPDGMVLGRLGQGQNTKGNPPWLLSPHTDQDVAKAEAWLAQNPRNQFGQPAVHAVPTPPASNVPGTAPAWGQTAPAASPAPATVPAWGQAPAAPAANWNAPAPAAPAPVASDVHPDLVAALVAKGVQPGQLTSQAQAEQLWAVLGG